MVSIVDYLRTLFFNLLFTNPQISGAPAITALLASLFFPALHKSFFANANTIGDITDPFQLISYLFITPVEQK